MEKSMGGKHGGKAEDSADRWAETVRERDRQTDVEKGRGRS